MAILTEITKNECIIQINIKSNQIRFISGNIAHKN